MGFNKELADILENIAALQELTGADPFRAVSNARAARIIADHPTDLSTIAHDRDALVAINGVGEKIADKILEYAEHGRIKEYEALLKKVPPGLPPLLDIPGLGPKTARVLWTQGNIESLDDLKNAIASGAILKLPRMGKKTVENISAAIQFREQAGDRALLGEALHIALDIVERLKKVKGVKRVEYAGSLRRGRETIGDIDILVAAEGAAAEKAAETFRTLPSVQKVLAAGDTKSSVRLHPEGAHPIQADLRVIPPDSFGAALLYFTGSKDHNVSLRQRALKAGYTLNEYGLFPEDDETTPPQSRNVKPVASKSEEDIYNALDLPFIPPELRENQGELDFPKSHDFNLISLSDIRAELHAHTTASDGKLSIDELVEAAKARGFHTIAITDHSKSQTIANGLSPDRLRQHVDDIHAARKRHKDITILAGTEVDILPDGSLDYDDNLLSLLDVVVASPHTSLKQSPDKATERLLAAIKHPLVHIIGHPCGRYVNRREGLSPDIPTLSRAAAKHHTALEINANHLRLDLRDSHARAALAENALLAIDCDVHNPDNFNELTFGVLTARRAGCTPDQCINAWPARKLHDWLKSKR